MTGGSTTSATQSSQPRDAGGRFVKRRRAIRTTARATTATAQEAGHNGRGLGHLATLTIAIILGVAGFAAGVFWIGALVLLGVLWGAMAVEHQQQTGRRKGVLAEVVDVVVDQAKDVAGSARDATKEDDRS